MKYQCIKEFEIQMCDDDCFLIENEFGYIPVGSIWEVSESNLLGGEVHLVCVSGCDDFGWIEITQEHFKENFIEIGE